MTGGRDRDTVREQGCLYSEIDGKEGGPRNWVDRKEGDPGNEVDREKGDPGNEVNRKVERTPKPPQPQYMLRIPNSTIP